MACLRRLHQGWRQTTPANCCATLKVGFSAASGWRHSTPPTGHNGAANTGSGSCSQVGYHIDFTPIELRERYGSQQNYIGQVARTTRKAKRDGFLVSADADRTIEEAKTVKF